MLKSASGTEEFEVFKDAFQKENPVMYAMLYKGDVAARNCFDMAWRMWQASANRKKK